MGCKDLFGICPYATSQRVLAGKWTLYILHLLTKGPTRFNELLRRMPGDMTHTTLSRQLKTLEQEGLIRRDVYDQVPPRVEYSLTEIGERFRGVLDALGKWGYEYIDFLKERGDLTPEDPEE